MPERNARDDGGERSTRLFPHTVNFPRKSYTREPTRPGNRVPSVFDEHPRKMSGTADLTMKSPLGA